MSLHGSGSPPLRCRRGSAPPAPASRRRLVGSPSACGACACHPGPAFRRRDARGRSDRAELVVPGARRPVVRVHGRIDLALGLDRARGQDVDALGHGERNAGASTWPVRQGPRCVRASRCAWERERAGSHDLARPQLAGPRPALSTSNDKDASHHSRCPARRCRRPPRPRRPTADIERRNGLEFGAVTFKAAKGEVNRVTVTETPRRAALPRRTEPRQGEGRLRTGQAPGRRSARKPRMARAPSSATATTAPRSWP